jgi:hypothetical protein
MEKPLDEAQIEIPSKASVPDVPVSSDDVTRLFTTPSTSNQQLQETKTAPMGDEVKSDQKPQRQLYAHGQSLSHLLPPHSYAQISPRCYLFAGAEVTLDNMDDEDGNSENSDSTDGESNDEFSDDEEIAEGEPKVTANEIIVPDIDNVMPPALLEVPVPEVSPTPSTSSVSSPARSQLECGDRETVETIDANIHHEEDAELQPAPMKKPRLDIEESIF